MAMNAATATFETSKKPIASKVSSLRLPRSGNLLQRKCACGDTWLDGRVRRVQQKEPVTSANQLKVSEPGDIYEQEAERLAENVLRMAYPAGSANSELAQRKRLNPEPRMLNDSAIPSIVREVLGSPGEPLDAETRAFMEPRFGYDFSRVRVHNDARAAESAIAINALAYTLGGDLVFGVGRYAPRSGEGQRLLAHELMHVVQQSQARNNPGIQRKVSLCCRHVETGQKILDVLASTADYEHCWLKTDTKTVGMGPAAPGPLPWWPFGIDTKLTDHSGETPQKSEEIADVDENCVNRALVIGKPTGKWEAWNNCNTFAHGVINSCMLTPPPSRFERIVRLLFPGPSIKP
jgi:Domain of unknown function (DUF4157)